MKAITLTAVAIVSMAVLFSQSAQAAARTWGNTGTDYNASASWNAGAGPAPGTGDVGLFTAAEVTNPNVSVSLSNSGLLFSGTGSSGYDITSSGGAVLTLTGRSTSGSGGTSDSSAAAIRSEITSGTNTIDVPLVLAPSSGPSTFFLASGGTLVVNSVISDAGAGKALSIKNGTLQLNGANTFSGGASIDAASTTLVVGDNAALGTGTFTINNTATIQATNGARLLGNDVVIAGNTTVSGGAAITFTTGNVTSSGSNTRTLTVSNTGGVTFGTSGTLFLQESTASGRTFTINGTSPVVINGTVADGGTGPATLKYTGSNTLTLNHANTYSGGTQETIAGSSISATHDGAFGAGNITLTIGGVFLTLSNGTTNNYIADSANLSIFDTTDNISLSYSGTDTINAFSIGGVQQAAGQWGAVGSGAANESAAFSGTGFLNVLTSVPESTTTALLGLGLLIGAQRLRRKTS